MLFKDSCAIRLLELAGLIKNRLDETNHRQLPAGLVKHKVEPKDAIPAVNDKKKRANDQSGCQTAPGTEERRSCEDKDSKRRDAKQTDYGCGRHRRRTGRRAICDRSPGKPRRDEASQPFCRPKT